MAGLTVNWSRRSARWAPCSTLRPSSPAATLLTICDGLNELRRLVGLLRDGDEETTAPQPGLADIEDLVEKVRAAGVDVELRVAGEPPPTSPGLQLSVFRIVQESLNNAMRHAPGATVTIDIRHLEGHIALEDRKRAHTVVCHATGSRAWPGRDARTRRAVRGTAEGSPDRAGRVPRLRQHPGQDDGEIMTIRVLVVDDQAMFREALALLLDAPADIQVVGQATNGRDAIEQCKALQPDVVVMDVRMPIMDGIEATHQIVGPSHSEPATRPRVLVLTTFDLDEHVYAALRAGASGFLLKDSSSDQLAAAVRTIAAGDALLAPSTTRRLVQQFARQRTTAPVQRIDRLTTREHDVLILITQGRSNAEIADALVLATETVKTHVGRILNKLDLRDRTQAAIYAWENHLVTRP